MAVPVGQLGDAHVRMDEREVMASSPGKKVAVGEHCWSRSSRRGWAITGAFVHGHCWGSAELRWRCSVVLSFWRRWWAIAESSGACKAPWLILRSKDGRIGNAKSSTTFSTEKCVIRGHLPPTWKFLPLMRGVAISLWFLVSLDQRRLCRFSFGAVLSIGPRTSGRRSHGRTSIGAKAAASNPITCRKRIGRVSCTVWSGRSGRSYLQSYVSCSSQRWGKAVTQR